VTYLKYKIFYNLFACIISLKWIIIYIGNRYYNLSHNSSVYYNFGLNFKVNPKLSLETNNLFILYNILFVYYDLWYFILPNHIWGWFQVICSLKI